MLKRIRKLKRNPRARKPGFITRNKLLAGYDKQDIEDMAIKGMEAREKEWKLERFYEQLGYKIRASTISVMYFSSWVIAVHYAIKFW